MGDHHGNRSQRHSPRAVELTEADFGTAADDERHRAKLTEIYTPRLQHLVEPCMLEPAYFFARYQLLRNLSHLGAQDALLLALPSRTPRY